MRRTRGRRGSLTALFLALLTLLLAAATALAVTGQLTQLPGTAGCVSVDGFGGACKDGKALRRASSVAVSANGESVYVVSESSQALAVFERDTTTGELTQLSGIAGCVSQTGSGGDCADGKALLAPHSVAVSADGKSVYVASSGANAVAIFRRNTTTGAVAQLVGPAGKAGCVSHAGSGGACADGKALAAPESVAVSADGANVYVASRDSSAIAVFKRNTTTSGLTQLGGTAGCINEHGGICRDGRALDYPLSVAVSADGKNVYVASQASDAVAVFRRDPTTGALTQLAGGAGCISRSGTGGTCAGGNGLDGASSVAVSADGKSVYVASQLSDAVAAFRRNPTTGALTQLAGTAGCVSQTGTGGACADGKALDYAESVAVAADGQSVYVASELRKKVAVFRRNVTTGALTQLAGAAGCVKEEGTSEPCAQGKALGGKGVATSGDGKSVYVASYARSAVAAFARETAPSS
jgi:DNA-binding beta-propeller fold protein YncE